MTICGLSDHFLPARLGSGNTGDVASICQRELVKETDDFQNISGRTFIEDNIIILVCTLC
jgi:hypothetical protein